MDKLKIAVYLDLEYQPNIGGIYSYTSRLTEMIDSFEFDEKIEVIFISKRRLESNLFKKRVLYIPELEFLVKQWTLKRKLLHKIFSFKILSNFNIHSKIQKEVERVVSKDISNFLSDSNVDLVYYLARNLNPLNYAFIATHWDVGTKNMFICEQIFNNTTYEKWDYYFRIVLHQAFAIFVESEQSKKELIEIEAIYSRKMMVLPLFPGKVVELDISIEDQELMMKKWEVTKNNFYFYPAQFWALKNHYGLIMAFKMVAEKYPDIKLVLSGSDKGNLSYINSIVKREGLEGNVIFTGFVSNEEIYTFYKNAIALVFTAFLGPTNMPLLEASYLGCPVVCTDLEGHKEQLKDSALYFDTFNHTDIANKMIEVKGNGERNFQKDEYNTPSILNKHFLELYNVRKTFD
jgi:glycosyltransferase involved in cell wall biosynthesis